MFRLRLRSRNGTLRESVIAAPLNLDFLAQIDMTEDKDHFAEQSSQRQFLSADQIRNGYVGILLTTIVEGGDQFESLPETCSSDFVVRERVSAIYLGRMPYAPVANGADILQLSVGYDTLAGITERFLQVTDSVLLKDERLEYSVKRKKMSPAANLAFKTRKGLDRGFGLPQCLQ